ncbi:MAG: glycosyltransferase family 1 protein [Actinomycetota bacterium]|nr:MAG: glycosyltransferase family 1 protein [Actinomycetota bacterium]
MKSSDKNYLFSEMTEKLKTYNPTNWNEISSSLADIKENAPPLEQLSRSEFLEKVRTGLAFWTFDFGIDGVSIEISKYAQCLQDILSNEKKASIHFIAGDFHPQADNIIKAEWKRHRISHANGWLKWDRGIWFEKLFYQDMKENSEISHKIAVEIWNQAVDLVKKLGAYIAEKEISLLIPVNVNSNPGNMATGLCTILVSELMGIYVLNSNHDFYWEGGKAASERKPGEAPGPRDKFFHNINNTPFFSFFKKIYPWNGRRWIQVNINALQSKTLIENNGFFRDRIFEISTSVSKAFFREYSKEDIKSVRLRMAHILSDGNPLIRTIAVRSHLQNLEKWMTDQKPLVCSNHDGQSLDLTSDQIIYFLQPTRIIDRKRIEKNLHLIGALLQYPPFLYEFDKNKKQQIVLHITGPAPIEHQAGLEIVLKAYIDVISQVPETIADRLFLAFSVGIEKHPSFHGKKFKRLTIEDIYQLATIVLFPSETEGRGLPIIESSAAGIPLICSRDQPEEIFAGVVGEDLPEDQQIHYIPFPEEDFPESFLNKITGLLLCPEKWERHKKHNIAAIHKRYSRKVMHENFHKYLDELLNTK